MSCYSYHEMMRQCRNMSNLLFWFPCAQELLDRGANVDAVSNAGRTALFGAAQNGHLHTVQVSL